ncbi:DUF6122 family protein [Constantimarinum furrinae]|uniref:Membrane protein n=1 Tax=Constantimarinum furrinae TaxID=2562285 RepID=A0A7G8PW29_9FLAO|nr:DUF6122 family protein [Constantimarinum furrinae]QNJ98545.1 Membrane protein [Constantimarinum furrinae]
MLQQIVHYSLHFLFPGVIAIIFYRKQWKTAWLIMIATMLVDLDHLLATPLFSADRCSINYHPLHSYYIFPVYGIMLFFKKTRILAIGLLLHMATDGLDCIWMKY